MSTTTFRFQALAADGRTVNGQLEASDETAALRELLLRGLKPLQVAAVGAAPVAAAMGGGRRRANAGDRIALLRELATLLGAGVSLSEALPSLAEAYSGHALGPGLALADRAVRSGQRLSEGLRASGAGLPPYVFALAQAGEASGALAEALADAATQLEHEHRIAQELRNALIYPAVLVVSGVLAVGVIFVGVVPRFASLLTSARAEVPALSRWTIEGGLFVKQHLLQFGLGAAALACLAVVVLADPGLRARALDAASRLPLIGAWLVRVDVGRWATVLATLLANRVPIVDAIGLSAGALSLRRLRETLQPAVGEIQQGRMLSDVLAAYGWFPPARVNLIRVGERAGELPRMLATLGTMETESARTLQKRVLALIEPAAILIIGAVIGIIMIAVMLAITSLNTAAV